MQFLPDAVGNSFSVIFIVFYEINKSIIYAKLLSGTERQCAFYRFLHSLPG